MNHSLDRIEMKDWTDFFLGSVYFTWQMQLTVVPVGAEGDRIIESEKFELIKLITMLYIYNSILARE